MAVVNALQANTAPEAMPFGGSADTPLQTVLEWTASERNDPKWLGQAYQQIASAPQMGPTFKKMIPQDVVRTMGYSLHPMAEPQPLEDVPHQRSYGPEMDPPPLPPPLAPPTLAKPASPVKSVMDKLDAMAKGNIHVGRDSNELEVRPRPRAPSRDSLKSRSERGVTIGRPTGEMAPVPYEDSSVRGR